MDINDLTYSQIFIAKFVLTDYYNVYILSNPLQYRNKFISFYVLCKVKDIPHGFTDSAEFVKYLHNRCNNNMSKCAMQEDVLEKIGVIGYCIESTNVNKCTNKRWLNNALLHGSTDTPELKQEFFNLVATNKSYNIPELTQSLFYPQSNIADAIENEIKTFDIILNKNTTYYKTILYVKQLMFTGSEQQSQSLSAPRNISGDRVGCRDYDVLKNMPGMQAINNNLEEIRSADQTVQLINPKGDGECLFCCLAYAFNMDVKLIREKFTDHIFDQIGDIPGWFSMYYRPYVQYYVGDNYDIGALEQRKNMRLSPELEWMGKWINRSKGNDILFSENTRFSEEIRNKYTLESSMLPITPEILQEIIKLEEIEKNSSENRAASIISLFENDIWTEVKQSMRAKMKLTALEMSDLSLTSYIYWGDEMTISNIPYLLNTLPIVFNDDANIKPLGLDSSTSRGLTQYIALYHYMENHYVLYEINNKTLFQVDNIPRSWEEKIIQSGMTATYNLIRNQDGGRGCEYNSEPKLLQSGSNTILMITDKKMEPTLPGLADHEKIDKMNIKKFMGLVKTPNWREKLHHNHKCKFELDGKYWSSPVHFQMAQLFKDRHPLYYNNFSLDSHSKLSQDTALLPGVFTESGRIKSTAVRPKEITVGDVRDLEKELSKSTKVMHQLERAVYAKFKQNDKYSKILKETGDATLVGENDGLEVVNDDILMRVREKLNENS